VRHYFDSSKVRGEGNSVIFINQEILPGPQDVHICFIFFNHKGFQWNSNKYSIDNDYLWNTPVYYVSPMKWGDILFLALLSVRPSVRHTFLSALYLLNPWWDFQITLHKVKYDETMCSAYVWPRSGQGQGHNLRLNIVWLYFVSALYLLNPRWYLQITLHKCQVWWEDVQCLGLTKVGSRSRSQFEIKHCMTVFRVRSISFEPLVVFTNYFTQMSSMMRRCAVPWFDQGRF